MDFRGGPARSSAFRRGTSPQPAGSATRPGRGDQGPDEPAVGLPEVVGFAFGAGVMATALAALEASLTGSERARRLARDGGVRAELGRVAADRGWHIPLPRAVPAAERVDPPAEVRPRGPRPPP